jgi:hypothetical protein
VSSPRNRRLPALEPLEGRLVLSTANPANTLAVAGGTVPASGAVVEVTVPIPPQTINNQGRPIVIGTATSPGAGSGLLPQVVAARGPDGKPLAVQVGAPFNAPTHGEATAFVQDGTAGSLTLSVTGNHGTSGAFQVRVFLPGDVTGDGRVTLADLQAFTKFYRAHKGDALYNAVADANLNNQIGQEDARALVRNLAPLTPKIPLKVKLTLAPADAVHGHVPSNSGGHTYNKTVTILGRTTPGSVVFTDSGFGDFSFTGPALATDAHGNFMTQSTNTAGINNNTYLVVDPYGQQKIEAFPIYYFPGVYSRNGSASRAKPPGSGTTPGPKLPPGVILPAGNP